MGLFRRSVPAFDFTTTPSDISLPAWDTKVIQPDFALQRLSAVFRCIQVLSHMASDLDVEKYVSDLYVGDFKGFSMSYTDRQFIAKTVVGMAGWGNAYWRKPAIKLKGWQYLDVIHPERIRANGDGSWTVTHRGNSSKEILSDSQITHIPFLSVPGSRLGIGPLGALRETMQFSQDLHRFAANAYSGSGYPSGYLATEQQLPASVALDMKTKWIETFAKPEREIAVMSGGLKFEALTINPTDAAFVESFNLPIQDIGRTFGVPASFMGVGSGDSLTYSTSEAEMRRFIQTTLTAYTGPIEDAFTKDRGGVNDEIRLDFDSLLRSDMATRFAAYKTAKEAGWLTDDEIRAEEGRPALALAGKGVLDIDEKSK